MACFTDNGITWEWHSVGGRGTSGQGSIGDSSKERWLIDAGHIPTNNPDWARVGNIFLTHLHHDHVRELASLLTARKHAGCEDPVSIYVPEGQATLVHNFLSCYYSLVGAKSPHHVEEVYTDMEVFIGPTDEYRVLPFRTYHGDTQHWLAVQRADPDTETYRDVAAVTGDTQASVFADPENEFLLRPLSFLWK